MPHMGPMPPASAGFPARGAWLIGRYMEVYGLADYQAAGLPGNFGEESGGLVELQEIGVVNERGGYGWPQWTGPRRRAYEAWCNRVGLAPSSNEANFGYTIVELSGDYAHTIDALRSCVSLDAAVWSVGQTYERPAGTDGANLPGYDQRLKYGKQALDAYHEIYQQASPAGGAADGGNPAMPPATSADPAGGAIDPKEPLTDSDPTADLFDDVLKAYDALGVAIDAYTDWLNAHQ